MSDHDSDAELMARVGRGDDVAFAQLFKRHYSRVLNIIFRFLGSGAEAEDLAQETFLRIYRAAPEYQVRALFTTWLYQIVSRLCLNYRRDKGRRKTYSMSDASASSGSGGDTSIIDVADPGGDNGGQNLVEEEAAIRVQSCLGELAENQRMALVLMHYEGLGYAEIAESLGVSAGAAKALCYRARESMRELLERSQDG